MIDDRLPDDFESEQLELYHAVCALAVPNQIHFKHPQAALMPDEQWRSLCHNFAFYAAVARNGDDITLATEDGEVLMTSEQGTPQ
jgi:hypothetical protein